MWKSSEAKQERVGLTGLLAGPSVLSPDRLAGAAEMISGAWIGEALGETIERLRRMAQLRASCFNSPHRRVAD